MKQILKTTAVAFIVYKILDYLIHGLILRKGYEMFADTYRPDMMDYMWVFFVGPVIVIFLLTKLYAALKESRRCIFSIIMPSIIMIPAAFYTWASVDIGLQFTLQWFFLGFIQVFITIKIIEKMMGGCTCKVCNTKTQEKNA